MGKGTPRHWPWRILSLTLTVVTLAALALVVIALYRTDAGSVTAAISPDGRSVAVAYTDREFHKTHLRVINADQSGTPRFEKTLRGYAGFSWSPDSRHLWIEEAGVMTLLNADTGALTPLSDSGPLIRRRPDEGQTHRWLTGDRLAYQDTAYAWHIIDGQMRELGRLDASVVAITDVSDTRLICRTLSGDGVVYTHTGTLVTRLDSLYTPSWQFENTSMLSLIVYPMQLKGWALQSDTVAFIQRRTEMRSGYALVAGDDSSAFGLLAEVNGQTALIGQLGETGEWILLDRENQRVLGVPAAGGTSRVLTDLTAYGSPDWLWHGIVNRRFIVMQGQRSDGDESWLILNAAGHMVKSFEYPGAGKNRFGHEFLWDVSPDGRYLLSFSFMQRSRTSISFIPGIGQLRVIDLMSDRVLLAAAEYPVIALWTSDSRRLALTMPSESFGWLGRESISVFDTAAWQVMRNLDVFADQTQIQWPPYLAVAIILALMLTLSFGLSVIWWHPEERPRRVFALTTVALAWALLPVLPALWDHSYYGLVDTVPVVYTGILIGQALLPAFLVHLSLVAPGNVRMADSFWLMFPSLKQRLPGSGLLTVIPYLIYVPSLYCLSPAVYLGDNHYFTGVINGALPLVLLLAVVILMIHYLRTGQQDLKRQIALFGIGTGVALLGYLALWVAFPSWQVSEAMVNAERLAILSLLAIPPCGAWALRRDRVRDSATIG